jgi:hypothetical protein
MLLAMADERTSLSVVLQRSMSPKLFQFLRSKAWYPLVCFPRFVVARFIRRHPVVRGFGRLGDESALVRQIQNVNVIEPTKMCQVMTRHGSDKGRRAHNYTTVYSALLRGKFNQPYRIFELGLGTNNPELISTMGIAGTPGASLRGWREIFSNAIIYGADIDREVLFEADRITTYYCDQLDPAAIGELWAQPELQNGMDIIIEDGLHTFEANLSFLEASIQHVRPGGFYVVEDILTSCRGAWYNQLENVYSMRYPDFEFVFVSLPNPVNKADNNLLIAQRSLTL